MDIAKARQCYNIAISVDPHAGVVEVKDDGKPMNLPELSANSEFLKRTMNVLFMFYQYLDLRTIANYELTTRKKLAPKAETLDDTGAVKSVSVEAAFRNKALVYNVYRHVSLAL